MKAHVYFLLKVGVAAFGLVFQFTLFELFGMDFTGEVNRLQIWALFLSFLVLPGIEFSIVRTLPRLRKEFPDRYLYFRYQATKLAIAITVFVFILLFITGLLADESIATIAVIVALSFVLLVTRILPTIYRIEGRFFRSVGTEQGAFFFVATIIALLTSQLSFSPASFLILSCLVSLVALSALLFNGQEHGHHNGRNPQGIILESLRNDYTTPIASIAISNFALLWLPATVGTFLLSTDAIATSVSLLRLIGLLLFVEAAMVAFFMPKLSVLGSSAMKSELFIKFRRYITGGTLLVALAGGLLLLVFKPFGFSFPEIAVFIVVAVAQIIVCALGSPFALATTLCNRRSLTQLSKVMIFFTAMNLVVLLLIPRWETIILGFAVLQILRANCGAFALKKIDTK